MKLSDYKNAMQALNQEEHDIIQKNPIYDPVYAPDSERTALYERKNALAVQFMLDKINNKIEDDLADQGIQITCNYLEAGQPYYDKIVIDFINMEESENNNTSFTILPPTIENKQLLSQFMETQIDMTYADYESNNHFENWSLQDPEHAITVISERQEGDITYVKLQSDNIDIANVIKPDHEYVLDPNKKDIYWDVEDYQDGQGPMDAYIEDGRYNYEEAENPFARIDNYMKEDCYLAAALIDRYQKAEVLPESYHQYDIGLALVHGLNYDQYALSTNENGITIIEPMRQPSDCSWHMEIMQNDKGQVMGRVAINNEYVTDLNTLKQDHDKIFNIANQMIKIAKGEQEHLHDRDELSR